jgi:hypothetical protein
MKPSSSPKTIVTLAVLLGLAVLSGCGTEAAEVGAPSGNPEPAADADSSNEAGEIYSAVVVRLVQVDHTYGQADPGFKAVYVVDGVVPHAADPTNVGQDPAEPFASAVKAQIQALARSEDLPPLEFVAKREAVVEGTRGGASPGRVADGGVLISLGSIEHNGSNAQVPASLWINGLAGQWLTYVLEKEGGAWQVKGTTGPVAIS